MAQAHEPRRQRASDRSLAGDPIADICRAWACSKSGLSTWRDRSLATAPSWSAALRRRPSTTPTNTPQRLAQVVVALRQPLAPHGQGCGAAAIQQALAPQGIAPVPAPRTIDRMLHRAAKEVTSTHHHPPSVHQRATWLPVWTEPPRQGHRATGGDASGRGQRAGPERGKRRCARPTAWTSPERTRCVSASSM